MKVFVVLGYYDYEDSDVIGVFTNKEKAYEVAEEMENKTPNYYDSCIVRECILDEY